jgi:hypothetical protein
MRINLKKNQSLKEILKKENLFFKKKTTPHKKAQVSMG